MGILAAIATFAYRGTYIFPTMIELELPNVYVLLVVELLPAVIVTLDEINEVAVSFGVNINDGYL